MSLEARAVEFAKKAIWPATFSGTGFDHLGRPELSLSDAVRSAGLSERDFTRSARALLPNGMEEAFLPLRLVAVWISVRERERALEAWDQSRTLRRPITLDWREGLETLTRELVRGTITAWGFDRLDDRRRIDPDDWAILKPVIIGGSDFSSVSSPRTPEYGRVELRSDDVLRLWPPAAETTERVRRTVDAETQALKELCRMMREQPASPLTKAALAKLPLFRGVSRRGRDRIFTRAVDDTGAHAWRKGGRRARAKSGDNVTPADAITTAD